MADKKISQLSASTTPLAGTEELPIVQSGVTKRVSVNSLTLGKPVSVAGLTDTNLDASKPVFTDADKKLTNTGTFVQTNVGSNVAGTGPTVISRTNTNQDFTTGTFTKLTFSNEEYDTNSNFASGTFTPTVAGFYIVNTFTAFAAVSGADATRLIVAFYKNGSVVNRMFDLTITASQYLSGSTIFYANGTTDFYDIYVWSNAANPRINGGTGGNQVAYSLLRAA